METLLRGCVRTLRFKCGAYLRGIETTLKLRQQLQPMRCGAYLRGIETTHLGTFTASSSRCGAYLRGIETRVGIRSESGPDDAPVRSLPTRD